ncbi:MAG: hypothetical protein HY907_06475 [Deltaproteobacteria bacterium]|nr:hypothetical protein [Deltaproteobacteria bacterium]
MRLGTVTAVILAGLLAAGNAPMQCASDDREPLPTVPEAPEECYLLAQRLLAQGDVGGWRSALEYVIERFPDSRYAARARDDLAHGPLPPPGPVAP